MTAAAEAPVQGRTATPLSVALVEFNPSGGLFQFAVQLGEALADRGHRVQLLTGPDPELASRRPGFDVVPCLPTWHASSGAGDHPLVRRARRLVRAVRYHLAWAVLVRRLRHTRPDVVQFSGARFPVDGIAMAWLARRRGYRPLLTAVAHAPAPFNEQRASGEVFKRSALLDRTLNLGYGSLDAVMVLGERTAADLRAAYPDLPEPAVVPHGDEGVFLGETELPGADAGTEVLFFGTMQAYKGLDLLVRAWAAVRRQRPDARLVITGQPSGDTDLDELRRAAAAIGGVDVRPGYVPLDAVAGIFATARVVVAPYRYANASGVVELARTFARPVVATDVGDLRRAVQHGTTGLLVAPEDDAALTAALLRLLDDPAEARRMGEAGRAASEQHASWATVAERVEGVYRKGPNS
jgi:glycosyltransferase involved in cell wall biosynthesis